MELKRKSGILLHPTSLPSPFGIGDLGQSAYNFISFLERSNQKLWQVLPLGTTSFGDSPYQSFSAFAGNHYLISPELLEKDKLLENKDLENIPYFNPEKIEYGKVIPYKMSLYRTSFKKFKPTKKYKQFCEENNYWLQDYCLFVALKTHFIDTRKNEFESKDFKAFVLKTKKLLNEDQQKDYYYGGSWLTFPEPLLKRDSEALKKASIEHKKEIDFHKFLQFTFFTQWDNLKALANSKEIEIIGDIPIFVSMDSADVWANQELFKLNENGFPINVAGVPPDYFSETGQLWGNPLYKNEAHINTNFEWWIKRIKSMLKMCDILRIDHFRGFESWYEIKFPSEDAKKGKWVKSFGKEFFTALKKELGELPIIAEDLGIITPQVEKLRDTFKFPGMKVLQFAFDQSDNNSYLPHNYEKNCICYTGTHDNDTTNGWYNTSSEEDRDYFRRYMDTNGNNPCWDLIRLAIASSANIAIFPLQDVMSLGSEGRMNTPGVSENNWQWRFKDYDLEPSYEERLKYLTKVFKR